jgi:hypothetical protein
MRYVRGFALLALVGGAKLAHEVHVFVSLERVAVHAYDYVSCHNASKSRPSRAG